MSRYSINKLADEFGVAHSTAMLIAETCEDRGEFIEALEAFANGEGFVLID